MLSNAYHIISDFRRVSKKLTKGQIEVRWCCKYNGVFHESWVGGSPILNYTLSHFKQTKVVSSVTFLFWYWQHPHVRIWSPDHYSGHVQIQLFQYKKIKSGREYMKSRFNYFNVQKSNLDVSRLVIWTCPYLTISMNNYPIWTCPDLIFLH